MTDVAEQHVELGEIHVSKTAGMVFVIPNLGTGIAIVAYDTVQRIGGIAHVLLPESGMGVTDTSQAPGKYADVAVPTLIEDILAEGAQKQSIEVYLYGGAQLFNFGGGGGNFLNVGFRNTIAIRTALAKLGLTVKKADTGGNKARMLRFDIQSGEVSISQIGSLSS